MSRAPKPVRVLITSERGPIDVDGTVRERGELVETTEGEALRVVHQGTGVLVQGDPETFRHTYWASVRR
jgi:hypothetical protein